MKIQPDGTPTKKGAAEKTFPVSSAAANSAARSPPKRRAKKIAVNTAAAHWPTARTENALT